MTELAAGVTFSQGCIKLDMQFKPFHPEVVEFEGKTWHAKDELHCTLVSAGKHSAAIAIQKERDEKKVLQEILDSTGAYLGVHPIAQKDIRLTDEFRFVTSENGLRSIIRMVEVAGIEELFAVLNTELPYELPVQPTHVTIYTGGDGRGINLRSPQDVAKRTRLMSEQQATAFKQVSNIDEVFV
jgi:hypothetical protein